MSAAQLAPALTIDEYYELRLYRMIPGRMPAFHELMRRQVPPLFARHGIPEPIGMWESYAGPMAPLYAYILPWSNLDERMRAWKHFYADPDWKEALAANYGGQQRVDRSSVFILRPSAVWNRFQDSSASGLVEGIHELRIHNVLNQDPTAAHEALAAVDLPFFVESGAKVLGVFATWYGTNSNQAITILAWPDNATMQQAHRDHVSDSAVVAAREAERKTHGRPLMRGTDVHIMRPISYGTPQANLGRRTR
jgi:hypothetical protein